MTPERAMRAARRWDRAARLNVLNAIIEAELEGARAGYAAMPPKRQAWVRSHAQHLKSAAHRLRLIIGDLAHVARR